MFILLEKASKYFPVNFCLYTVTEQLNVRTFSIIYFCIQDWEAYAASHVSLSSQLEALTQIILDWRRLELKYVCALCLY